MNRYIITKEQIAGQKYMISALYNENKKMVEVTLEHPEEKSILGNIYIGRVENIVQNINAAFIQIAPGQKCYFPLEDLKHPIFTKKISKNKNLAAGDELLVQVSREAIKTKEPAVTTNLTFTGKYAVLTAENRKFSVSSKLSKEQNTHFRTLLKEHVEQDDVLFGIIIRTNAAGASDEAVLAEIQSLQRQYETLCETAKHQTCYSLLYQEPPVYIKHMNDLYQNTLSEIVTDEREVFEQICENYHISKEQLMTKGSVSVPVEQVTTKENICLRHYTDDMISLSALYSVKANLEDALKTQIWLKSGAYLIIEHTEALTVIDVNTGKNVAKKQASENFLRINQEAAIEIARQLRLRNISGMILVDFMNLKEKKANEELLEVFRGALKKDPIPTQLIDITKLGLVEITRKKVKKSLREVLLAYSVSNGREKETV